MLHQSRFVASRFQFSPDPFANAILNLIAASICVSAAAGVLITLFHT